jgi:hypothetical protein
MGSLGNYVTSHGSTRIKIVHAKVSPMTTNPKLRFAQGLAIAATIAIIINTLLGLPPTQVRLLFAGTGILLAAAAFGVSWGRKSVLISVLLLISGILLTVNETIYTINFSILVIPGPIIGVILGLVVLGLGIAKSISTATKMRIAATTAAST